ncbi:MAG TPA: hypothetical protein VE010_06525 [Thermoanaerobaculia bacterium]|nr:hypothetical protein [Thermoanaerobaculia bacterium]
MQTGSVYAGCKTDACKKAVAWKHGYTAVVLHDEVTRAEYFGVLEAIREAGGTVAIEAERALLGWVPVSRSAKLRVTPGVIAVFHDAVPNAANLVQNEHALEALSFYNRVMTGLYEDSVEASLAIQGKPLTACVVDRRSPAAPNAHDERLGNDGASPDARIRPQRSGGHPDFKRAPNLNERISANFWFREPFQNPDMRGRVTVQVFRLDSNGSIDPNLYTWSAADFTYAKDQVNGAFTFWASEAANRGISLSFRVSISDPFSRYLRRYVATPTSYEPITRGRNDRYLWINDALSRHGYGASPVTEENVFTQNEAFNRDKKADPTYGPFDRSFSVYVPYNPPPASTLFADGTGAHALYDGPFTVVMWDSNGWGPDNLGRVLTHETGHIFWACDEYYEQTTNSGCFTCQHCLYNVGPRNQLNTPWITNANCAYPAATSCMYPRVDCVMDDNSYALCPHTPRQVGW